MESCCTQLRVTRVFFISFIFRNLRPMSSNFHRFVILCIVEIHQVGRLVVDNYQQCSGSLIITLEMNGNNNFWLEAYTTTASISIKAISETFHVKVICYVKSCHVPKFESDKRYCQYCFTDQVFLLQELQLFKHGQTAPVFTAMSQSEHIFKETCAHVSFIVYIHDD